MNLLNQEQMLSLLRTSLQILGTYIVAHSTLGSDSAHLWELVSGLIMVIAPTVWSMFAHSDGAMIKNVTAMNDVKQIIVSTNASNGAGNAASDPGQPKVVRQ